MPKKNVVRLRQPSGYPDVVLDIERFGRMYKITERVPVKQWNAYAKRIFPGGWKEFMRIGLSLNKYRRKRK